MSGAPFLIAFALLIVAVFAATMCAFANKPWAAALGAATALVLAAAICWPAS